MANTEFFKKEAVEKMKDVFGKMEKSLILKLYLNKTELSDELFTYMTAMAELTDKLSLTVAEESSSSPSAPYVEICYNDGASAGLAFHGVPGGHELDSFVRGLYNAAGPGDPLDASLKDRIAALSVPLDIKVLVTLSCPMCPDLVVAAQRIAAENAGITAHIYDVRHFVDMRDRYNVMSVPCLVINNERISVGRRGIKELLDFIEN